MSTLFVNNIKHTGGTSAMTIDSSGRILQQSRPSFHIAGLSSDFTISSGSDHTIEFSNVVHNDGSHWDTSTYQFNVPVDGLYHFCSAVRVDAIDSGCQYYMLGVRVTQGTGSSLTPSDFWDLFDPEGFDTDISYMTFQLSRTVKLTAGNIVKSTIRQQSGTTNHAHIDASQTYTQFSGYLVG